MPFSQERHRCCRRSSNSKHLHLKI